jgi:hypothetical protein
MSRCPACHAALPSHSCPGSVPPEPPIGTWMKDRYGGASVRNADGWAPATFGFYGTGKWESMWAHRGPYVPCGPYGRELPEDPA